MAHRVTLLAGIGWSVAVGHVAAQPHNLRPDQAAAPPDTLTAPPVLKNLSSVPGVVEVTLTAAPTRLALLPGAAPTDVYAYEGHIPGPTLEVHEGDRVTIHFHNELPETTTVHWHGLHLPADQDGSPFDAVPPGSQHDYVFTIGPGTAGTYWYHPHPDRRAGYQVAKGLFGAIIVRAADDPLSATVREKLLILSDNRFLQDGSIDLPDANSPQGQLDAENGREGDVLYVNGQVLPRISIRRGELQRWRVINASAARVYRLALAGQGFLQVGSDGGLFERPVKVDEVLLANSERVELLVRGPATPGAGLTLQTLPYDRYVPQTRPADWNKARDLLTLNTSTEPALRDVAVPAVLRHVPVLDTAQVSVRRVIVLTQGMINRQMMDLTRVDLRGHLGTTEIWEIENLVGMDHPFHLHGFRFQVLDRNGVPEPYPSWKDTVNVPKHETVRVVVRFEGYGGKWMFHCHILDHEDHGMMGVLELN